MSRIAIDIVLLPPEKIMDLVIAINKEEAKKGNSKGELNKVDFLPHLSLAMGTIEEKNLEKVDVHLLPMLNDVDVIEDIKNHSAFTKFLKPR